MSEIHPSRQNQIQGLSKITLATPAATPIAKPKADQSETFRNAVKPVKKAKQVPVKSTSQKIISKNASRNERRKKARQVAALLRTQKPSKKTEKASKKAKEAEDKMAVDEEAKELNDSSSDDSSNESS